jgi:uncharacterized protein (TIGR02270 family)
MHPQDPATRGGELPSSPLEPPAPAETEEAALLDRVLQASETSQGERRAPVSRPIGFHPREISALINKQVVGRHADEAPFLWLLRDRAVAAPHYSLRDLAMLDERVEAHVDGLRLAGDYGWGLCEKALEWLEPGEIFTAGLLALESGNRQRVDLVLEKACSHRRLERGVISATGWIEFEPLRPTLESWLGSEVAALRRLAVRAFGIHRQDPGQTLVHCLFDDDPGVRASSLKTLAELGRVDLLPMALHARGDVDPTCRYMAAEAAARLGDRSEPTLQHLREMAESPGPLQERALSLVAHCLPREEAIDWLRKLWKDPVRLRMAALGVGAVGDPTLAGVTIEWMEIDDVARVAGQAFSMITGADLKYLDLDRDPPENEPAEGEDEFEVLDEDRDLPFPDVDKVAGWWRSNRDRLEAGRRYLCGLEIEPTNLRKVLVQGEQRQRAAAALELALLEPSVPLFEVRARGSLQERRLLPWTS